MKREECAECVCIRCKLRVENNCCELCKLNGYVTPINTCENDDVLIERLERWEYN